MIARKALDTIKTGIDYASDLAEVQNVVDVLSEALRRLSTRGRKSVLPLTA